MAGDPAVDGLGQPLEPPGERGQPASPWQLLEQRRQRPRAGPALSAPDEMGAVEARLAEVAQVALAFAYSLWAIAGAGADVVYWGFLLLFGGLPVYVWIARSRLLE